MPAIDTRYRNAVKRVYPHIYALPMKDGWFTFNSQENHEVVVGPVVEFEDVWKRTFWKLARMVQLKRAIDVEQ